MQQEWDCYETDQQKTEWSGLEYDEIKRDLPCPPVYINKECHTAVSNILGFLNGRVLYVFYDLYSRLLFCVIKGVTTWSQLGFYTKQASD